MIVCLDTFSSSSLVMISSRVVGFITISSMSILQPARVRTARQAADSPTAARIDLILVSPWRRFASGWGRPGLCPFRGLLGGFLFRPVLADGRHSSLPLQPLEALAELSLPLGRERGLLLGHLLLEQIDLRFQLAGTGHPLTSASVVRKGRNGTALPLETSRTAARSRIRGSVACGSASGL